VTTSAASGRALEPDVAQLVREHQQAEREEQPELRDPCQALVEGHDRPPRRRDGGAEHEPRQVDREEAGAVQRVGEPVGQRRRGDRGHGPQARRRQAHAAHRRHGQRRDREAADEADRQLAGHQPERVEQAEGRALDGLDAADHEQDRDRIVDARLPLERARQPPPQRGPAQHREDRGRVARRDGRAEQQRLERREVEDQARGHGGQARGQQRPEGREGDRGPQHRADLVEAAGQAALEEDQRQRDDADLARELEVGEVDPARAVGADQHPEREDEHEARHPHAARGERRGQASSQQDARDQEELALVHGRNPARLARKCGS
jgi:hypothetical protein